MKSHCEHTDRGYTLVEIIIAIALGLVVMG
ncbi:MAG: prepilin-type N-terminal cleavage/methylation domain-containing protein [Deltaproteobacteria bacterium]|nr:prepilin-type N-terminal cleavage/methylation domain-containing protein [Deltaproteobacteria bacterium]